MLRNFLRKTAIINSNISTAKKPVISIHSKHFSSDVDSWVKIYKEMREEAGKMAETSVGNVRSDISSVRSEMNSIKSDINSYKIGV